MPIAQTDLQGKLPLVARGKVRDIYEVDANSLLFVATDRISAYDVVMKNGIPDKGKILTKLSEFWFKFLSSEVENHLIKTDEDLFNKLPHEFSTDLNIKSQLEGRSLLVKKFKILPLECIVRGYITGSAWSEYKESSTVHGCDIRTGMKESEAFHEPIYTPSTKAEQGEHDQNIDPDQAIEIVGEELANGVRELSLKLYKKAREYALEKGIIIADTKFEFGVDESNNIVLVDEVLTPDSSRFWSAENYEVGKSQNSYDKQYLRDWLTSNKLKGVEGVSMPEDVVANTREKYVEAYELLTGNKWE